MTMLWWKKDFNVYVESIFMLREQATQRFDLYLFDFLTTEYSVLSLESFTMVTFPQRPGHRHLLVWHHPMQKSCWSPHWACSLFQSNLAKMLTTCVFALFFFFIYLHNTSLYSLQYDWCLSMLTTLWCSRIHSDYEFYRIPSRTLDS